jgi:hypothetical protein
MVTKLRDNPLFDRLTRNAKPPSLRVCLWLAFGLGLVTLAYMSWMMLYAPVIPFSTIGVILMVAAAVLIFLLPILVGIIAATLTARDTQGEEYQLLRLANLSPRTVVWGYIGAALHRMRLLLALMIGTMPALVMGTLWVGIRFALVYTYVLADCYVEPCGPLPSTLTAEIAIICSERHWESGWGWGGEKRPQQRL